MAPNAKPGRAQINNGDGKEPTHEQKGNGVEEEKRIYAKGFGCCQQGGSRQQQDNAQQFGPFLMAKEWRGNAGERAIRNREKCK